MTLDRRNFLASGAPAAALLALRPGPFIRETIRRALGIHRPPDAFLSELPALMEVAGVPGVGMAVVQDGHVAWTDHRGVMDASTSKPATADTLWPAASLSKPVFTYAALKLVDEGKLDLDRPLKSYLPDHAPADARGDRITARHVLSHSSGLRNWRNRTDQPLVPDFEPGTRFQYSGEGYYYLMRVVEHIAGLGFDQFMQERLFGPLGMTSSSYVWREDTEARLVTGHDRGQPQPNFSRDVATRLIAAANEKGRTVSSFTSEDVAAVMASMSLGPPQLPNYMIPNSAGSLTTTPAEYAAFMVQLMTGGNRAVALEPKTRDLMLTSHTPINRALSWGLGLGQETHAGEHYGWHWGDNGNWKNFVLVHPVTRSGAVVFTNGSRGLNVANRVVAAASDGLHEAFLWL